MSHSLRTQVRNAKRSLTSNIPAAQSITSAAEKIELLEETLSAFQAEVELKLNLIQRILISRNEQVAVHRKLLAQEQSLYASLMKHWRKSASSISSGVSCNIPEVNLDEDQDSDHEEINESSSKLMEEDSFESDTGPASKKSKSSLRKQRKSRSTAGKGKQNQGRKIFRTEDDEPKDNDATVMPTWSNVEEDDGSSKPLGPGLVEEEYDSSDPNETNEFSRDEGNNGGNPDTAQAEYITSSRGSKHLIYQGFIFKADSSLGKKTYWKCLKGDSRFGSEKCKARCITTEDERVTMKGVHNHFSDPASIEKRREKCELREKAWALQHYYEGLKNINDTQTEQADSGSLEPNS